MSYSRRQFDREGDEESDMLAWYADEESYTGAQTTELEGDTVSASELLTATQWRCEVTPVDEDNEGASASASFVTSEQRFLLFS